MSKFDIASSMNGIMSNPRYQEIFKPAAPIQKKASLQKKARKARGLGPTISGMVRVSEYLDKVGLEKASSHVLLAVKDLIKFAEKCDPNDPLCDMGPLCDADGKLLDDKSDAAFPAHIVREHMEREYSGAGPENLEGTTLSLDSLHEMSGDDVDEEDIFERLMREESEDDSLGFDNKPGLDSIEQLMFGGTSEPTDYKSIVARKKRRAGSLSKLASAIQSGRSLYSRGRK
jgi:hypothetical protein